MEIILDVREAALIEKCESLLSSSAASASSSSSSKTVVTLSRANLPIGDVMLRDSQTNMNRLIIERKTLDDLLASIKDGRYEEQSFRLQHNAAEVHHRHHVVYLIEGVLSQYSADRKRTIYGAITSLNFFKGFSVIRTSSTHETAELILAMAAKIYKDIHEKKKTPAYYEMIIPSDPSDPSDRRTAGAGDSGFSGGGAGVSKIKRENITTENIWEIMLTSIPYVSPVIAHQLMETFQTIPGLVAALDADASCLSNYKLRLENGKSRKLGSNVAENLRHYLCTRAPGPGPNKSIVGKTSV
jgi:ERCC4-type nuclease